MQDLPAIVSAHTSVQLEVTADSPPYWWVSFSATSSGGGLPGVPHVML